MPSIHSEFSSFNQAQSVADRYAKQNSCTMFVVYESGAFFVATEEDLDTFFMGLSDNQIRYSTGDGD
jgi:hypothetical protein